MDFTKIVRIGTIKTWERGRPVSVFCKIEMRKGRLSISGVEGPLPSGNALGACGQIDMHLRDKPARDWNLAPGWNTAALKMFFNVWKRWHLNDMKAGGPEQEQFLRDNPVKVVCPESHYEKASAALAAAGLNPDASGYKYGSAWRREDVPVDVLAWLQALPDADKKPAWV